MAPPTVIDANCLKYFQDERVAGTSGVYSAMIGKVQEKGCLAVDDEGHAQQEYNDCCRPSAVGLNLCDWIADQIVERFIVLFPMDKSASVDLKKLGVPKKDQKWPAIAKGAQADFILTEDIDLFDPKAKAFKSAAKAKIKAGGGPVSKYLAKQHGINVSTAEDFLK
ncbi:MAG: hypothetical protein LCH47_05735 [Proteobacteria bacterium]|nr:hypothetical protein [Pseudomonadota bacterium]